MKILFQSHLNVEHPLILTLRYLAMLTKSEAHTNLNIRLENDVSSPNIIAALAIEYNDNNTPDTTFQYALALCKSDVASERRYGIGLNEQLIKFNYAHPNDCLYSSSIGYYLLEDFQNARRCAEAVIASQPDDANAREVFLAASQALDIEEQRKNVAVGSGVAALGLGIAIGVAGILIGKKR